MPLDGSLLGADGRWPTGREMHAAIGFQSLLKGRARCFGGVQSLLGDDVPRPLPCGGEAERGVGTDGKAFPVRSSADHELKRLGGLPHANREAGYRIVAELLAAFGEGKTGNLAVSELHGRSPGGFLRVAGGVNA